MHIVEASKNPLIINEGKLIKGIGKVARVLNSPQEKLASAIYNKQKKKKYDINDDFEGPVIERRKKVESNDDGPIIERRVKSVSDDDDGPVIERRVKSDSNKSTDEFDYTPYHNKAMKDTEILKKYLHNETLTAEEKKVVDFYKDIGVI